VCLVMPDTKTGREKKGQNKRSQLTDHLVDRELAALDGEDEPPEPETAEGEFLAEELPDDR